MDPKVGPCVGLVGLTNHVVAGSNPRVRHRTRGARVDPQYGLTASFALWWIHITGLDGLTASFALWWKAALLFLLVSTPAD